MVRAGFRWRDIQGKRPHLSFNQLDDWIKLIRRKVRDAVKLIES
jgi:hypothetical protein